MCSIASATVIIEPNVNFNPSNSNVYFRSSEQFNSTTITVNQENLTVDNITYKANSTNQIILNISLNSTLKKFVNTNNTISASIEFYNLSLDTPYNDVLNYTSNIVLYANANNYNTSIGPSQETRIGDFPSPGTLQIYPKGTYTNSLWMLDFGLVGGGIPDYNTTVCGSLPGGTVTIMNSNKKGNYALSYNSQKGSAGSAESRRLSISKFPRRIYSNTYRVFFWINGTTTENTVTEVDLNLTSIINRTSSSMVQDIDTYRLYRISRYGGIHNDTGLCYEQPIIVN